MKWEGKITKSSIYSDHISEYSVSVEAESVEEAAGKLNRDAIRFDIRSGSSLVQDVMLRVDGRWRQVSDILRLSTQTMIEEVKE